MLASVIQFLNSRLAGLLAVGTIVVLGVALMATVVTASRTETQLRAQIAQLSHDNRQAATAWRARLTACETGALAGGKLTPADLSLEARAQRLAQTAPAGFDACARMESADRAVVETLR